MVFSEHTLKLLDSLLMHCAHCEASYAILIPCRECGHLFCFRCMCSEVVRAKDSSPPCSDCKAFPWAEVPRGCGMAARSMLRLVLKELMEQGRCSHPQQRVEKGRRRLRTFFTLSGFPGEAKALGE